MKLKTLLGTEGGTERVILQVSRTNFYFMVKAFGLRLRVYALGRGLKVEAVRA